MKKFELAIEKNTKITMQAREGEQLLQRAAQPREPSAPASIAAWPASTASRRASVRGGRAHRAVVPSALKRVA